MIAARSLMVLGVTCLAGIGLDAQVSEAQQPVAIETVFPAQAPRGQPTVLNVAFPGRDLVVQAVEISPAAGVTVSGLKPTVESQGVAWWELTVDVAKDAEPGNRSLVLVMAMGRRTLPARIMIPSHVPSISDLRIVSAQSNQPAVELQFAVADESGDLGNAPYIWFTIGCGDVVGVVKGSVTARDARNGVVHALLPNRRTPGSAPPAGACDLKVRATDASGIESNTLMTRVDFKK